MLISCEQWRKDFGVDDLVKCVRPRTSRFIRPYGRTLETLTFRRRRRSTSTTPNITTRSTRSVRQQSATFPVANGGRSPQDGRPVYIEQLGKLDIPKLYAITTVERQLKRLVYEYEKNINERMPACSRTVGHPVETSCTILDLNGVSISNFYRVKDYVMQMSAIGQDRYPETMGKFYIINAPWAFSAVWSIIKPWLDEVTVSKIDILGRDYKGKLLTQIPAENLPKEFGGKCECPGGCSLSDAGPWHADWEQPTKAGA